ncbi:MAG: hypothetical protein LBC39_07400 [Methanobrevibacter sp.]|jgi:hypothetical protein|nr:hypothetical protein [Candidatus Methanovirga aequatorialis]
MNKKIIGSVTIALMLLAVTPFSSVYGEKNIAFDMNNMLIGSDPRCGTLGDVYDKNPVINKKTSYDFSFSEEQKKVFNDRLSQSNLSNYELSDSYIQGVKNDYFNVSIEGNKAIVEQLKDIPPNSVVLFMKIGVELRNKNDGSIKKVALVTFLADKNPSSLSVEKKIINPVMKVKSSDLEDCMFAVNLAYAYGCFVASFMNPIAAILCGIASMIGAMASGLSPGEICHLWLG